MAEYDLQRLAIAIQYMKRMADGRNPVNNQMVPEDSVLNNPHVIRCLGFIREVLEDVAANGGIVNPPVKEKNRGRSHNYAEEFPYEVLSSYQYKEDLQISYFLRQIMDLAGPEKNVHIPATAVTNWLRQNGYLEKKKDSYLGKEVTAVTDRGMELGISSRNAGTPPNEYYRTFYNRNAQEFLVKNLNRILHEAYEEAQQSREERNARKRTADQITKELMPGMKTDNAGTLKGTDAGTARLIDKILEDPGATARYIRTMGSDPLE